MRLSIRKELQLSPYELTEALKKCGLVDNGGFKPNVQIVEKTDVNEGRTVIIAWSLRQERIGEERVK